MSFLTPLFLIGLLAAAIPVAIHLIRREKPPKIVFGTLRFIKSTTRKLVLFQQVSQWLLLLLRAGVICLLVLAFARPLFDQSIARMLDSEPKSVVIVLDASLSMHYGDTFEEAREAARDILDSLSPGDEAALVTYARSAMNVSELTTDLEQLRSRLDSITAPGYDVARTLPALRLANELLEESRFEARTIHLISDFQATGVEQGDSGWMLSPGVAFNGVDVGQERTRNLVLTDVRSPRQLIEDESDYEILARVRSTGSVHLQSAEVSLRIDGQTVARKPVELDDRSEAVVTLPASFESSGSHVGEVVVSGDDFLVDNSWHFTIDVLSRIRVLIVNGEPSPNWFDDESHWLTLALQGMGSTPFIVENVDVPRFDSEQLRRSDVVVLLNVGGLESSVARDLGDYVRSGGTVLFAPGDQVAAETFNRQFADISPAQLDVAIPPAQGSGNDYLLIVDVDRRHPALRPLDLDWSARFEGVWAVNPAVDAQILMRFDNGLPALLEREVEEGRSLMFASPLDLEWSNLPLQGLFVPFMHETLRYLVQPPLKQTAYLVGDLINLDAELTGASVLSIRDTDGAAVSVPSSNPYYTAQRPGIVTVGSEGASYYAVNIPAAASDLRRTSVADVHDRIINPETRPVQSREVRAAQLMAEMEQPQRLWWWILGMVLLLLLVEGFVANRTYR